MDTLRSRLSTFSSTIEAFKDDSLVLWEVLQSESAKGAVTPAEGCVPGNEVPGCTSRLWWTMEVRDGLIQCSSFSDALLTRTIVGNMSCLLSGLEPSELSDLSFDDILQALSVEESDLSMRRVNALVNLVSSIRAFSVQLLEAA